LQPATVSAAVGELLDTSVNRSPTSYAANPADERELYEHDTDKNMTLLRFDAEDGSPIGTFNWFAVHGTSMNNTNKLLSGDNKGYAALRFEEYLNDGAMPGTGSVVTGFASTNLGDVSPNTEGAHCTDTGEPCDPITSTCNGKNELCVASGPGKDMFESTQIIGEQQFKKAKELYESDDRVPIKGEVDYRLTHLQMDSLPVTLENGTVVNTCTPAMGYSFAAGTTDGPGMFDFTQGTTSGNPFWDAISHLIADPSDEDIECQAPKPILLATGLCTFPYDWAAHVVSIQILRMGNFVILAVPAEFTTMSGRRLRKSVHQRLVDGGVIGEEDMIVIAGLANGYADYVATYEEYQQQRYEAASTIYGPHTLEAYIQEFLKLADAMVAGEPVDLGPSEENLLDDQWELLPGVIVDGHTLFGKFGAIETDVESSYTPGQTASVTFQSACPRNNLMTEDTFLTVERKEDDGSWTVVYNDGHWETKFKWGRHSTITDESFATIEWDIPTDTPSGTYRIQHFGYYKPLIGDVKSFSGTSSEFTVSS